jgi:acetyl-CoA synthetase
MPLLPENWITVLVSIKGGFQLIPAATMLSVQDIVYRFGKLMPGAAIADRNVPQKLMRLKVLAGKSVPLKIIVAGSRKGWISFEKIEEEESSADAADTNADDPLFLFFTSGTTGCQKW